MMCVPEFCGCCVQASDSPIFVSYGGGAVRHASMQAISSVASELFLIAVDHDDYSLNQIH